MAANKRVSQKDLYNLSDDEYRDYRRAELSRLRGTATTQRKRGVLDVLLTVLFFIGIVLVVMHQNGMIGK